MATAVSETTGDLRNNLMKLTREVKRMKMNIELDLQGLSLGCPSSFLQILHASLMHHSLVVANWLTRQGYELYSKSDLRFIEELYKVLREVFHYHPKLTKEQFLCVGFAERKVILTTQVLLLAQNKHIQLVGKRTRKIKTKESRLPTGQGSGTEPGVHVTVVDNRADWVPGHSFKQQQPGCNDNPSPLRGSNKYSTTDRVVEFTPHTSHFGTENSSVIPPPLTVNGHLFEVTSPPLHPSYADHSEVTPPPLKVHPPYTDHSEVTPPPLTVHPPYTDHSEVTPPPLTVHPPYTDHSEATPPPLIVHPPYTDHSEVTPPPLTVHACNIPLGSIVDTSVSVRAESFDSGAVTAQRKDCNHTQEGDNETESSCPDLKSISKHINDLTTLVETMSAKFVLIENQMKLVESRCHVPALSPVHYHPSQPSDTPTHPSQPYVDPIRLSHLHYSSILPRSSALSTSRTPSSDTPATPTYSSLATPTYSSPATPDEAHRLIADLRTRAKRTRDFLQQANSRQL